MGLDACDKPEEPLWGQLSRSFKPAPSVGSMQVFFPTCPWKHKSSRAYVDLP